MICINKFSKLALMVSLLVGSVSCVQAMDDEELSIRNSILTFISDRVRKGEDDQKIINRASGEYYTAAEVRALIELEKLQNTLMPTPGHQNNDLSQAHIPQPYIKDSPRHSSQPFAKVLQDLEGPDGAQIWQNRADQNKKQMEQRQVVRPLPQPHNPPAAISHQEQEKRLNAMNALEAQKNTPPAAKPAPANMGVNRIAALFGGQGGFTNTAKK